MGKKKVIIGTTDVKTFEQLPTGFLCSTIPLEGLKSVNVYGGTYVC